MNHQTIVTMIPNPKKRTHTCMIVMMLPTATATLVAMSTDIKDIYNMNHRTMNINQVIKNTIVINYMVPNLKDTIIMIMLICTTNHYPIDFRYPTIIMDTSCPTVKYKVSISGSSKNNIQQEGPRSVCFF